MPGTPNLLHSLTQKRILIYVLGYERNVIMHTLAENPEVITL